jgi:glutamyl-tRNA reductase
MAARRLDPAVVALRQHISGAVEKEMTRLRAKYPSDIAADVELALHRVTQSLLHTPTLRAKELARTGDGANYLQALHTLFGIDLTEAEPAAHTGPVRLTS